MTLQWFPGHMNVTRKAIAARMPEIDVVIELLDARLPGSSTNPLLAELAGSRPSLKVLNKQDLADPERTAQWLATLNARPGTRALALDASVTGPARLLIAACRELAPLRGGMVKPVRVLVCGIPNVGKSTLINTLAGQRTAHSGDEPGITKVEQKIMLDKDFHLFDTPGMLWPRLTIERAAYHLAASGGIGRNAYDEEDVALALLVSVRERYGDRLGARYRFAATEGTGGGIAGMSGEALLQLIGRRQAGLLPGGHVNLQKAAEIVLNDFRHGAWGRITLETPEDFAAWSAAAELIEAERSAKLHARRRRSRAATTEPDGQGAEAGEQ